MPVWQRELPKLRFANGCTGCVHRHHD
ncbi:hypothetical protein ACF8PD_05870 [Vibrio plantisponsor]